jgi:hypothetical protein
MPELFLYRTVKRGLVMELFCQKTKNNMLSACNEETYKKIVKMPIGQAFLLDAKKMRNMKFHNAVFGLAALMSEHAMDGHKYQGKTSHYIVKSALYNHGFREMIWDDEIKAEREVPLSVAVANMDDTLFQQVWEKAICVDAADIFGYEPEYIAQHYKDIFSELGKTKMGYCVKCYERPAVHRHHIFENTKLNRKLYGKLLDNDPNIQYLCEGCHLNDSVDHMGEEAFCAMMDIEVRSKSGTL